MCSSPRPRQCEYRFIYLGPFIDKRRLYRMLFLSSDHLLIRDTYKIQPLAHLLGNVSNIHNIYLYTMCNIGYMHYAKCMLPLFVDKYIPNVTI